MADIDIIGIEEDFEELRRIANLGETDIGVGEGAWPRRDPQRTRKPGQGRHRGDPEGAPRRIEESAERQRQEQEIRAAEAQHDRHRDRRGAPGHDRQQIVDQHQRVDDREDKEMPGPSWPLGAQEIVGPAQHGEDRRRDQVLRDARAGALDEDPDRHQNHGVGAHPAEQLEAAQLLAAEHGVEPGVAPPGQAEPAKKSGEKRLGHGWVPVAMRH
jgi:hypothetical protein